MRRLALVLALFLFTKYTHLLIGPGRNWECAKKMKHGLRNVRYEQVVCNAIGVSDIKPFCVINARRMLTIKVLQRHEGNSDYVSCIRSCASAGKTWAIHFDRNNCYCSSETKLSLLCHIKARDNERVQTSTGEEIFNVYRTPVAMMNCHMPKRYFPGGKAPPIGIISYPGSGNTWFRHLLEKSTGFYTGSVYAEKELFEHGFFGEMVDSSDGTTFGVKDHNIHGKKRSGNYEKSIILIRNPYDAFVAEFNRKSKGHIGHRNSDDFITTQWTKFVWNSSKRWQQSLKSVIAWEQPKLVIYYDDLIAHTRRTMKTIVTFLEIPPRDLNARLNCLVVDNGGFFRRKKSTSKRHLYTRPMIKRINNFIGSVRVEMLKQNLHTLPPYEMSI